MKFGRKKLYIDGTLSDATEKNIYEVICLADEQIIAELAWAGKEDTKKALIAAQSGIQVRSSPCGRM